MRVFNLFFTGDHLGENGQSTRDIGLDTLTQSGYVKPGFLMDQKPSAEDASYWDRLYSLEITPQHIAQANGIVILRPWVKASAFANGADNLVVFARAGAGYDKIDVAACTANDVLVFNSPDTLTHSTASAALTLMLALAKKLPQQQSLVRTGRWDRQIEVLGDDLIGKTLGIIGLGKTGLELARLIAPFHMRLRAFSPNADPVIAESLGVELVELGLLLRTSDFVSLHCRLENKTRGMLGAPQLRLLKPTAYLINVGRGELIHEDVLIQALREKWIAGAGLDVFQTEPLPVNNPLLDLENVILTPHWLASTHRASRATRDVIVRNVLLVAQGLIPQNVVNPEVLTRPGFRAKLARFSSDHPQQGMFQKKGDE